eukprot:CAMPEP_0113551846 /NCGR_PEP_ID=MMETSP0015_2-20120614/14743_1 /TAXON_ID=2838 /ORGANISM="Odontella" /LENGTH=99 /DNA_ID=CAMNT_0000452767 /DNA_START=589 /DNA_END=888 /DNA_ORIENTATION=+ /assembly_acc=CAM_ASM_000160
MKASLRAKWLTPAAAKISPMGRGQVKSRHRANHPVGKAFSTPVRNETKPAVPTKIEEKIAPTTSCWDLASFAETRMDGSGRGISSTSDTGLATAGLSSV